MTSIKHILPIEHIVFDPEKGKAMIAGTRFSVAFLATFLSDPEWTGERIAANYPLTPAQIHAAWSYYYDHQEEIDRELSEEAERPWIIGVDADDHFSFRLKEERRGAEK